MKVSDMWVTTQITRGSDGKLYHNGEEVIIVTLKDYVNAIYNAFRSGQESVYGLLKRVGTRG